MRTKTLLAINLVASLVFFTSLAFAKDPEIVGKCIGYLAKVNENGWPSQISSRQQAYMSANNSDIQKIIKINGEVAGCMKPGQPLDGCLRGYSSYDSILFQNFNTGISFYAQARKANDKASIAPFAAACVE